MIENRFASLFPVRVLRFAAALSLALALAPALACKKGETSAGAPGTAAPAASPFITVSNRSKTSPRSAIPSMSRTVASAIGPSDSVFLTDSWKGRIVRYDASGALSRSWKAEGLKRPTGIALDAFGHVIVSDRDMHRVDVWPLDAFR